MTEKTTGIVQVFIQHLIIEVAQTLSKAGEHTAAKIVIDINPKDI